ncbi:MULTISPECIES: hypothetical protein [unclassified Mesorhizobium]|uniref:hypothetical protein n=1 Tax=unclassified Mesorhizobium TaxID=325217 RepID=UPI000FDBB511|nr:MULTISPECIES: hypothetical protein [unclassified Mesorhizobium]TGQ04135.1 hypothetical protein EN862_034030 [Mesorhizobium sp. M2E.F.Ca.ET.219.01.1.1]TGS10321.1 hypothetical protein EN852_027005 [Mesorhizobium sp. M2E.F.Ca.ET.209.01.1.1]TGT63328.1 hypothetical protein EN809_035685 [Mesorhizobium sp. M2E.F.Ca.ET.166.01.1.1]TGV96953.1 hypothetical protein EN797_035685 [Mesorhizobium sp. M2E.F.Ca.ET.154.01.1.1]
MREKSGVTLRVNCPEREGIDLWLLRTMRRQALVYRDGSTEAADELVALMFTEAMAEIRANLGQSLLQFGIMRRHLK